MLLANATAPYLWLVFARLTNPTITDFQFNTWYNTQLLPSFMANHNASLAVRYKYIPFANSTRTPTWPYVAVYKTHEELNATAASATAHIFDLHHSGTTNGKRDIGPDDVAIELSAWTPVQTFESLREGRGDVPEGRPRVACIVRLEPAAGADGERNVEEWYRYQVGDLPSPSPSS